MSGNGFYSRLAPFYRDYSRTKHQYLASVDKIVLSNLRGKTMLDVGAGDGIRARAIADRAGIEFLVLAEPNSEMFELCEKTEAADTINTTAQDLDIDYKFDVITCLWNVLGHIENQQLRIESLKRMAGNLTPDGRIFLDVNNRYNRAAYGFKNILKNISKDILSASETNGDFSFHIKINGEDIAASGHIFNPKEIRTLIEKAGLQIVNQYYINYTNGSIGKTFLDGQLLFELKKRETYQSKYVETKKKRGGIMARNLLVVLLFAAVLCLVGCKKAPDSGQADSVTTMAEFQAKAKETINKQNLEDELEKLEKEIQRDIKAEK
ncbi:MAG: methyltransferase domain-containing protein [Planctomycetes bacterium]|nr:methyltransferase domain-containing protein [Planctomycetota bacterium]